MKIVHLLSKQAVERWPGSKRALEAQKRLARMYIHIGDYEKADAAATKLIGSFSGAEGIAAAIEDVADKYQMVGSQAKSYPLHRYVVEHWAGHERAIWCQMKAIMAQLRLGDLVKAEDELGNLLGGFAGHKELGPAVHEVAPTNVLEDEQVATSLIAFETDGSEVLVIYKARSNAYPDCGRKRREGSRGILNAFELDFVGPVSAYNPAGPPK